MENIIIKGSGSAADPLDITKEDTDLFGWQESKSKESSKWNYWLHIKKQETERREIEN
jgi:hypothetical protein